MYKAFATAALISVITGQAIAQAEFQRASDLMGTTVVTQDGRELGKVRDIAIDKRSGEMKYIVVSVGSFLIESSLIAVEPAALEPTGRGALTLMASETDLRDAKRFADDQWPATASISRSTSAPAPSTAQTTAPTESTPVAEETPESGTATIADATKIAYLTGNERTIQETSPPSTTRRAPPEQRAAPSDVASTDAPRTRFDRLDQNRDGVLDRAEIAHEMTYKDSYSEIDSDGNDVIDRDEFGALDPDRQ